MVTAKDLGSVPGVAKTNKNSKDKHCMIPLTTGTWNSQINRDRRQNGGSQELRRERKEGFVFDEYSFSLGKWKVLEMDVGDVMWMYLMPQNHTLKNV